MKQAIRWCCCHLRFCYAVMSEVTSGITGTQYMRLELCWQFHCQWHWEIGNRPTPGIISSTEFLLNWSFTKPSVMIFGTTGTQQRFELRWIMSLPAEVLQTINLDLCNHRHTTTLWSHVNYVVVNWGFTKPSVLIFETTGTQQRFELRWIMSLSTEVLPHLQSWSLQQQAHNNALNSHESFSHINTETWKIRSDFFGRWDFTMPPLYTIIGKNTGSKPSVWKMTPSVKATLRNSQREVCTSWRCYLTFIMPSAVISGITGT